MKPHFHRCNKCESPFECWCPFPERLFDDQFMQCRECCEKEAAEREKADIQNARLAE